MEKLPSLILLAIGAVLMLAGWRSMRTGRMAQAGERRLAAEGVETQAQVTQKRGYPHPRHGQPGWFVDYSFTVSTAGGAPQTFHSLAEVSQADFERLNVGEAVTVRYVASDPQNSALVIDVAPRAAPMFVTDAASGLVIGTVMILIGVVFWLR